jgi:hypothetical protein
MAYTYTDRLFGGYRPSAPSLSLLREIPKTQCHPTTIVSNLLDWRVGSAYPPETVDYFLNWALPEELLAIRYGGNFQGAQILKLGGEFVGLA